MNHLWSILDCIQLVKTMHNSYPLFIFLLFCGLLVTFKWAFELIKPKHEKVFSFIKMQKFKT